MKRFLTLAAIFAACSAQALAQDQITEVTFRQAGKIKAWYASGVQGPDFEVRATITEDLPLFYGDTSFINLHLDRLDKAKVSVSADGREVKIKRVHWHGPEQTISTPVLRTTCYSYGRMTNCNSIVETVNRTRVLYTDSVAVGFKPEIFALISHAREVKIQVGERVFELTPAQLAMLRDLIAAARQ